MVCSGQATRTAFPTARTSLYPAKTPVGNAGDEKRHSFVRPSRPQYSTGPYRPIAPVPRTYIPSRTHRLEAQSPSQIPAPTSTHPPPGSRVPKRLPQYFYGLTRVAFNLDGTPQDEYVRVCISPVWGPMVALVHMLSASPP